MRHRSFIDASHANRYLNGCIILLNKEPFYVVEVFNSRGLKINGVISHQQHLRDKYINIALYDEAIDMTPFPIGFINISNGFDKTVKAIRGFRAPIRASHVGLCYNNFYTAERDVQKTIMYSKDFYNTVVGKFPSINEAINKIGKSKIAFSRNFAISEKGLWYLHFEEPVGYFDNGIKLKNEYSFLEEMLEKDIKRAA